MTEKDMSKRDVIELLVNDYGWDESLLKAMTLDALKTILDNAEALKKAQAQLDEVKEEVEVKEKSKTIPAEYIPKQKEFDDHEMIEVMNGATQRLIYVGELDGYYYDFARYGDREEMPYAELKLMARRQRDFLKNRYIIILNDDVIESLRLGDLQTGIYTNEDLREILLEDSKGRIRSVLKASEATQQALLRMAVKMKQDGELRFVSIVEAVENHFGVRLDDVEIAGD